MFLKHQLFLHLQMLHHPMERRLMTSTSLPRKIITDLWLLKRKAVIRVRFPDNHTLEATFHPSETVQSLIDLLTKVIAQPEQPFHMYTTPPKKLITNISQDFYTAGFCPGAIVYFSYNVPKGDSTVVDYIGPYLHEEVLSLKGLDGANDEGQQSETVQCVPEPVEATQPPSVQERKPAGKKLIKPKWLKM